jgi:hypothetical protein
MSCPAGRLCVAFDRAGDVITTRDATGGAAAWNVTKLGVGYNTISQVTCPSRSLCVAVDNAGNMVTSTDPAGGTRAWKVTHVGDVGSLSCPSASLCAMYDGSTGNVITSKNPAGGQSAWKLAHADTGTNGVSGIICASARLCVAFDGEGNVITSTNPTGGSSAWRVAHADTSSIPCGYHEADVCSGSITAIACPSVSLCVAVDGNGYVLTSTDPSAGAPAWTVAPVDVTPGQYNALGPLSCPSVSLCVAADFTGNMIVSTRPMGGTSTWNLIPVESNTYGFLTDLSCPAKSLCVGVTDYDVVASRTPTATWTMFPVDRPPNPMAPTALALSHVTCPSVSLCIAIDGNGRTITSSRPTRGARAWKRTQVDNYGLSDLACPTESLCIAADDHGNVLVGSRRRPHG